MASPSLSTSSALPSPPPRCSTPPGSSSLAHLKDPDSASGLARRLRLPRQRVNYHLKVLETAGLVELVEERRKGNCLERVVRATARAFVISPEALGELGPTAETAADRLSGAYLIAAAGRAIRDVADWKTVPGRKGSGSLRSRWRPRCGSPAPTRGRSSPRS